MLLLGLGFVQGAAGQAALRVTGAPTPLYGDTDEAFMHPMWAPDGTRLAFTGSNYEGLWTLRADGRQATKLTDEPAAGFGFSWSADGSALLTRVARYEGRRRLNAVKVFDTETAEARLVTDFRSLMPALPQWAPDDATVVLYSRGRLETFDTGRPPVAGKAADTPVTFVKDDRIGTLRLDTGALTEIEPLPGRRVLNLTASPDGEKVAFEIMGGNLYVMDRGGANLTDLGPGHRPQWSPNSQWIVYQRTEDDGHRFTAADLFATRADGGARVQLTDTPDALEMNPAWSPDGTRIAYDDQGRLFVLPVAY